MHYKVFHTILFADDTNILNELNSKLNVVLCCISKWFQNSQFVLNFSETHIAKFAFSELLTYPLNTAYNNRTFTVTDNIKS
jgi:hypothetical protein